MHSFKETYISYKTNLCAAIQPWHFNHVRTKQKYDFGNMGIGNDVHAVYVIRFVIKLQFFHLISKYNKYLNAHGIHYKLAEFIMLL